MSANRTVMESAEDSTERVAGNGPASETRAGPLPQAHKEREGTERSERRAYFGSGVGASAAPRKKLRPSLNDTFWPLAVGPPLLAR